MLRRHVDLVLALMVAATYGLEIVRWSGTDKQVMLLFAVLGAAGVGLRRRTPVGGFLLAASSVYGISFLAPGFDNESVALLIVFFVSLYSLGRHATGSAMWLGAGLVLLFLVAFVVGDSRGRPVAPGDIVFATFFVGTPWAAGVAIRLRKEREDSLAAHNVALQRDQEARAREAVAAERSRIARELHDVVSHAIAVTVLQARGGRKMIGVDDSKVRQCLDAIEHTNAQALSDMRRLLSLLHDADADRQRAPQPSLARLDPLIEQVRASGLPVEVTISGVAERVPPGVDLSGFRIVQEALTNVLKHAGPGARAQVEVSYGPDNVDILIENDGAAVATSSPDGRGLIGIRERVAVVGGAVEAGPGKAGGFVVRARLPYGVES